MAPIFQATACFLTMGNNVQHSTIMHRNSVNVKCLFFLVRNKSVKLRLSPVLLTYHATLAKCRSWKGYTRSVRKVEHCVEIAECFVKLFHHVLPVTWPRFGRGQAHVCYLEMDWHGPFPPAQNYQVVRLCCPRLSITHTQSAFHASTYSSPTPTPVCRRS